MSDTAEHEVFDGEVEELEPVEVQEHAAPGTAMTVRPPGREVLMPMDVDQVVEGMEAYQELLPRLLADSDYQDAGGGKRFVKKSGWRKIARAFNLSVITISSRVERAGDGTPMRAEVVCRAIAPNGQLQDADGYCSADEPRFKDAKGKQKLENDLRATATTRAKNRAIADLVGMGEVSAEEVSAGGGDSGPSLPAATEEERKTLNNALNWFLPDKEGELVWNEAKKLFGGELNGPVCKALVFAIETRKRVEEAAD